MNFKEYAEKYDRDEHNNFAVACYEDNSIEELKEEFNEADIPDCDVWGISKEEFIDAVETAIFEKENEK